MKKNEASSVIATLLGFVPGESVADGSHDLIRYGPYQVEGVELCVSIIFNRADDGDFSLSVHESGQDPWQKAILHLIRMWELLDVQNYSFGWVLRHPAVGDHLLQILAILEVQHLGLEQAVRLAHERSTAH